MLRTPTHGHGYIHPTTILTGRLTMLIRNIRSLSAAKIILLYHHQTRFTNNIELFTYLDTHFTETGVILWASQENTKLL